MKRTIIVVLACAALPALGGTQYGKIRDPDLDEGDFVFRLTTP